VAGGGRGFYFLLAAALVLLAAANAAIPRGGPAGVRSAVGFSRLLDDIQRFVAAKRLDGLAAAARGPGDGIEQVGASPHGEVGLAEAARAVDGQSDQEISFPQEISEGLQSSLLEGYQILSYYGNPYTADMGILGELQPEALVQKLKDHARLYDSLNGARGVQAALHLVYATAQPDPGPEGLYLLYVDEETLQRYVDLARENGLLIFLDLQIGRSDVGSEMTKILPYLEQPHVHAALDPEFAMPEGKVPGESIGSLDAADVNAAQALLQGFVEERDLPDKVLIVHQFTRDMLTNPELIEDYPRVRLVIDMDGFGPSEIKRVKYGWYAAPAEYSGFKLFFRHDTDLMSEQDVLALEPDVVIYQ
jgi:hypothetical protein